LKREEKGSAFPPQLSCELMRKSSSQLAPKLLVLMLPDLRFLRAIEPPIDDCVVQEAERRQRISVNSGFGEGKGQVAIDTAGNVFSSLGG
jgi:hypothetical protein